MEAVVSQTRAEIGSTTADYLKGVMAETISKIWTIPHEMAEKTLCVTIQLNRQDENTSLAINLGTNDRMLRYRRIKSQFLLTPFSSQARREARGATLACRFLSPIRFYQGLSYEITEWIPCSATPICSGCWSSRYPGMRPPPFTE